ncbi:hypothetical protein COO60DRAFT_1475698 [Scenedesmus sp. NREL 46B-D3]|nr:hypothetical protein COO60DRAFT_1475698 [Scenedesmus sp. NREL 46B-D3]
MFDILFVGSGPHCLTTLLRLLEPDADTLVDHSTRKTTPKARALQYWHKQRSDPHYRQATIQWLRQHVAVVDPCGAWMGRWQQQFRALQIRHLRSSSAVHPDPLVRCWPLRAMHGSICHGMSTSNHAVARVLGVCWCDSSTGTELLRCSGQSAGHSAGMTTAYVYTALKWRECVVSDVTTAHVSTVTAGRR